MAAIPLPPDPPPPEPEETEERKINRRPMRDELKAMNQLDAIMDPLDDTTKSRVLFWLVAVHGAGKMTAQFRPTWPLEE